MSDTKKRTRWTLKLCLESAKPYRTIKDWLTGHASAYKAALREGWLEQCRAHMDGPRTKAKRYWTKERCMEEAAKHKTRTAWRNASKGSYVASHREGWIEECCAHMPTRAILKPPKPKKVASEKVTTKKTAPKKAAQTVPKAKQIRAEPEQAPKQQSDKDPLAARILIDDILLERRLHKGSMVTEVWD